MASSAPLQPLLPSLVRLSVKRTEPVVDTDVLAERPQLSPRQAADLRRQDRGMRQQDARDREVMDRRLMGAEEMDDEVELQYDSYDFTKKLKPMEEAYTAIFRDAMGMTPTELNVGIHTALATEWSQLPGNPYFWRNYIRFYNHQHKYGSNTENDGHVRMLRNVFERAGEALAFVSTQKDSWQTSDLSVRLNRLSTFATTYNRALEMTASGMAGTQLSFPSTAVEKIAYRLMTYRFGGDVEANVVEDDEWGLLQKTVQMANSDPFRPDRMYNLDSISVRLTENDGSRYPRYSEANLSFARKPLEGSPPSALFHGFSVFPETFRDYCSVRNYALPSDPDSFPEELTTYNSYYLNGIGKLLKHTNHAMNIVTTPRLTEAALKDAAGMCHREVDYFTVDQWSEILAQYARARSPTSESLEGNFTYPSTEFAAQFLAPGVMYTNDLPPPNETYYHMEVWIRWSSKTNKRMPTVSASADHAYKHDYRYNSAGERIAYEKPHWASKLMKGPIKEYYNGQLVMNYLYRQKLYAFEFQILPVFGNPDVFMLVLGKSSALRSDTSPTCVDVYIYEDKIDLNNLFSGTRNKQMCNLAWAEDIQSGYGMATLRVLQDAAMYLGVEIDLTDGSYTPSRRAGTPDDKGNIFWLAGDINPDEDYVGLLTTTLLITRGYGFYEGEGFFPVIPSPGLREQEVLYAEERIAYHHMLVTTPISSLYEAVRQYFRSDNFDWNSYPNSKDPELLEKMATEKLKQVTKLQDFFRQDAFPALIYQKSLRDVANMMNRGELESTEADSPGAIIINKLAEYVRPLIYREIVDFDESGYVPYLAYELRLTFYDNLDGTRGDKIHYVVEKNEKDPNGPPVVRTRTVRGVDEYRYVKGQTNSA